jgi:hypothetical protein
MKAFLSFLAVPFLLIATASADWVIESKIESPQLNSNTTTKVKGDKLRVDIPNGPAGAMSSIIDTKSGESIQILHAQKMAMKTSSAQLKQAMDAAKQSAGIKSGGPVPALQATGEKEKVGDYNCEIYTWTDGGTTTKLWVTKDHPQAAALKSLEKQMRAGFFGGMQTGPDTSTLPGVSVKTEVTMQGQKITTTIVSVKDQAIDAKDFEIPAGYQSMALPGAPGGN